jgi:hypothetical protein
VSAVIPLLPLLPVLLPLPELSPLLALLLPAVFLLSRLLLALSPPSFATPSALLLLLLPLLLPGARLSTLLLLLSVTSSGLVTAVLLSLLPLLAPPALLLSMLPPTAGLPVPLMALLLLVMPLTAVPSLSLSLLLLLLSAEPSSVLLVPAKLLGAAVLGGLKPVRTPAPGTAFECVAGSVNVAGAGCRGGSGGTAVATGLGGLMLTVIGCCQLLLPAPPPCPML